ncbi:MAG: hypothetical protein IJI19_08060 [Ruminococcus sp.]|nr:hypothetical protein [Ruminococcus sp.]
MTSLQSISGSLLYYLIGIFVVLLVIGQTAELFQAIRYRRDKKHLIVSVINLLLCFALLIMLMDFSQSRVVSPEDYLLYKPFQLAIFAQPWLWIVCGEMICTVILILLFRSDFKYRKKHLTPDAIRQTVDLLPAGICISDKKGTVLLSNLKMNAICRELTGHLLSDANRFAAQIEAEGEKQNNRYFVKLQSGTVCQFEQSALTESGREYNCLKVIDVTERFRVTEELKTKNAHLQEIRRRMQAVSDLSGDMFVAQEEAAARAALHNQLGQVLLMGRHYLEHPDDTDANLVYITTTQMNAFLLGEYKEPTGQKDDLLTEVLWMARSIGVTVNINGSLPEHASARTILAHAIQECVANCVKHAKGDRLMVTISDKEIVITNNGKPPKGEIAESGGLLSLRRSVEEAGGTMTVQSQPEFELSLSF